MDTIHKIGSTSWSITLVGVGDGVVENFVVAHDSGKFFHGTIVEDTYPQPLFIEHDQGLDKVGDVVIQFRQHPQTHRYMVQFDQEKVFVTETLTELHYRAVRSSVDNVAQAVKRPVSHSGWLYANARRLGGKPIKTHYVVAGWSPQLVEQMMDVFDYVQSLDALGLASFLKALQHMPDSTARAIFDQMRTAPRSAED